MPLFPAHTGCHSRCSVCILRSQPPSAHGYGSKVVTPFGRAPLAHNFLACCVTRQQPLSLAMKQLHNVLSCSSSNTNQTVKASAVALFITAGTSCCARMHLILQQVMQCVIDRAILADQYNSSIALSRVCQPLDYRSRKFGFGCISIVILPSFAVMA